VEDPSPAGNEEGMEEVLFDPHRSTIPCAAQVVPRNGEVPCYPLRSRRMSRTRRVDRV
jgi:hypothetical protein